MKVAQSEREALIEELCVLRKELTRLTERVAVLEAEGALPSPAAPPAAEEPAAEEAVSEEALLLISAAVAAFLGKRPRIRQVRLVNSAAWALQGRVSIQASHARAAHPRSGASS